MSKHDQSLNAVFDASLDGLLALSKSTGKLYATAAYSAMFPGWQELRCNESLESIRDFYSKYIADVDHLLDLIAEVRKTRELREGRMRLHDGRILHVTGRVVKTPDDVEIDVWSYRDITEQCQRDEQLQLRLQLITTILDASDDGIIALFEGAEKPLANAKYASFFPDWEEFLCYGLSLSGLEEFFSRYIIDWKTLVDLVIKLRQTGQYHQTINHHKDGRIFQTSGRMVNTSLARYGALKIYTVKDITGEVHGRQKMQAMQLTVDNLSEPVVWCDLEGKITYVNQEARIALGYDEPAEIIGKPIWRFYTTEQNGDNVFDAWNATLATLRKDTRIKFDYATLVRKDGASLPYTILIDHITQGREPFLAMYFHDLSEQIQRIEAERAAEAKSDFLARMSHEIRTPMNAIIGLSEVVQREYGAPKGLEYITHIKNAGKNLIAIINDILDFSKIESGRLDIIHSPYEMPSLLNDVLTIIRVRLTETPLELILDISPALPHTMIGDVGRIRQILLNLLSNAIKYTKEGFIKFSALLEVPSADEARLIFIVEDSGIGIRQEHMPKLFGDFSRIDEKHNISIEGAGLGLAITRSLCRAMGGDVTVQSEYGKGSVFTATLTQTVTDWTPMGDMAEISVERDEKQPITFTAPKAEVLIVDDFLSNLLVAEGLLAPYGMRVYTCLNGREAVELVKKRAFDLVLMDHMMPEMDGMEATRVIRNMNEERCRTLPIVALTANAVVGMKEKFLENGFDDFLAKPIDIAKLDAMMKKWLPADKIMDPPEIVPPSPKTGASETAVPEIEGVDVAAGIARIGGSQRRYLVLLETFRRDVEAGFALLEKEPDKASLRSFTTATHALKGALANIGANELSQKAALLEKASRRADMPVIHANLALFRKELAALGARIGEISVFIRAEDGERHAHPEAKEVLTQVLTHLQEALKAENFDAADNALARLQALPLAQETREAVSEIEDLILMADIQQATDAIAALLKVQTL
ncbi:MAG: response regulator [Candidatus Accumulibacter sp.]|jgi:PAS domain S-box-containing protein|nr:response regulator [Accumulibacter sp.]